MPIVLTDAEKFHGWSLGFGDVKVEDSDAFAFRVSRGYRGRLGVREKLLLTLPAAEAVKEESPASTPPQHRVRFVADPFSDVPVLDTRAPVSQYSPCKFAESTAAYDDSASDTDDDCDMLLIPTKCVPPFAPFSGFHCSFVPEHLVHVGYAAPCRAAGMSRFVQIRGIFEQPQSKDTGVYDAATWLHLIVAVSSRWFCCAEDVGVMMLEPLRDSSAADNALAVVHLASGAVYQTVGKLLDENALIHKWFQQLGDPTAALELLVVYRSNVPRDFELGIAADSREGSRDATSVLPTTGSATVSLMTVAEEVDDRSEQRCSTPTDTHSPQLLSPPKLQEERCVARRVASSNRMRPERPPALSFEDTHKDVLTWTRAPGKHKLRVTGMLPSQKQTVVSDNIFTVLSRAASDRVNRASSETAVPCPLPKRSVTKRRQGSRVEHLSEAALSKLLDSGAAPPQVLEVTSTTSVPKVTTCNLPAKASAGQVLKCRSLMEEVEQIQSVRERSSRDGCSTAELRNWIKAAHHLVSSNARLVRSAPTEDRASIVDSPQLCRIAVATAVDCVADLRIQLALTTCDEEERRVNAAVANRCAVEWICHVEKLEVLEGRLLTICLGRHSLVSKCIEGVGQQCDIRDRELASLMYGHAMIVSQLIDTDLPKQAPWLLSVVTVKRLMRAATALRDAAVAILLTKRCDVLYEQSALVFMTLRFYQLLAGGQPRCCDDMKRLLNAQIEAFTQTSEVATQLPRDSVLTFATEVVKYMEKDRSAASDSASAAHSVLALLELRNLQCTQKLRGSALPLPAAAASCTLVRDLVALCNHDPEEIPVFRLGLACSTP